VSAITCAFSISSIIGAKDGQTLIARGTPSIAIRGKLLGRYTALLKCVFDVDREALFLTSGRPLTLLQCAVEETTGEAV